MGTIQTHTIEAVERILEDPAAFPPDLEGAFIYYAESTIEYLPRKHRVAISDAFEDWSLARESFAYLLGVHVGRALEAGGEVDAEQLVADVRDAWEAQTPEHTRPTADQRAQAEGYRLRARAERQREAGRRV